ncbi:hypothetical protein GCM10011344_15740 [Dokdonia pacifica]|uniref:Cadherin domain-containing protein n=2 Tax=Dokdonia pacifica TaxID=1627892 RepID=A0A238W0N0_9FLAO|nr:hypothetical protein GCM10011344_15740 [Dokdonia pacifica]SNR39977.1 hypothetical protein SAMN06265376_101568 [Dokdonia pacifica]
MYFKFLKTFIWCVPLCIVISCSDDQQDSLNLEASDLVTTVTENPAQNDVLGAISVNESDGTIFSVSASDPMGAISVDSFGQVLVSDPAAFDFETRTSVTATISIVNGDATTFSNINISITDADDLQTLLTTSRTAYENTSGWIEVTEEEYNVLAARIAGVSKVGVSDTDFNAPVPILQTAGDITVKNDIDIPMPFGSYLFAFKYYSTNGTNGNAEGQVRPKVSEGSPTTGYIGRGPLPPHSAGFRYFVRAESVATNASNSYLAIYSPYSMGWKENFNSEMFFRFGNGSDLTNGVNNVQILIQGLVTPLKQWD